jgi:hypothetical protein
METLDLLRTQLFADEIANSMPSFIIKAIIKFAHTSKMLAEVIQERELYDEYQTTPQQIDFDIKAITYNLIELRRALTIRSNRPFQEFTNGAIVGLN